MVMLHYYNIEREREATVINRSMVFTVSERNRHVSDAVRWYVSGIEQHKMSY